jgi:hypothetical protein
VSQVEEGGRDGLPPTSRRGLLSAGLGLLAVAAVPALGGCTPSDPRIDSDGRRRSPTPDRRSPSGPASPTTVASPGLAAGEQSLADLAGGILVGVHRAQLSASRRKVLAAVREAHLQHVAALDSATPADRPLPADPAPTPTPLTGSRARASLPSVLAVLAQSERSQAERWRRAALAATGSAALVSGSLSVAATSYSTAVTASTPVPTAVARRPHSLTAALSDVEALQQMVAQLHAIVYGYQLALGHLSPATSEGRRAAVSLRRRKALRDRLEQALTDRAASVPAAAGAYVPSVAPTSAARASRLVRQMETALLPFCGLWLASATRTADRTDALGTLTATEATARAWGAPLTVWPGWQD